ncbi:FmdB family zinc ribbon protein [Thermodesulfobacteriota bacterium]
MVNLPSRNLVTNYQGIHQGRRFNMPFYDFLCEKCKKVFILTLSISEYEKKNFKCPKCKSVNVKQQLTNFQVKTSKKS